MQEGRKYMKHIALPPILKGKRRGHLRTPGFCTSCKTSNNRTAQTILFPRWDKDLSLTALQIPK